MLVEKKTIEVSDFVVTISVSVKKPPKPGNENIPYDHWSEELKELVAKYEEK